ncbi:MAG TPA: thioredoxin family protein [Fimbriimonadaceae bacterium]|nr:thioredoxin family protein [Fimbriimonadaceae bacterium]
MRRILGIGAFVGLAAFVIAQVSGTDMLNSFAKALNSSKSVSASYTIQKPIGPSSSYQVDLAKPNKARIESPTEVIVADGNTITTYTKADNTYFKKPQTDAEFKALFANDDLGLFGSFFDANYYGNVVSAKPAGTKVRKGVSYNVVDAKMDQAGKKTVSFYLDPSDQLARVAMITTVDGTNKDDTIIATKTLTVNGDNNSAFVFNAPADSKELSLDDINAGRWFSTWADASAMSQKTGKPIFIDFFTDWCHWCKVLDAEVYPSDAFKAEAKNWVLLKIDAEKGEGVQLAAKYGVNAYPTIKYVKADGTLIGGFEGYMPTDKVVANMQSAHH